MCETVLAIHIAAGAAALTVMWVPMISPKGGRTHRRAGWIFVWAMSVLSVTALLLSGWLLTTPDALRGMRLLLIAVITMNSVSAGVRVLRFKERTRSHSHAWDLGLPVLVLITSCAIAWYAVRVDNPVLLGAAGFGLLVSAIELRYWLGRPVTKMGWWLRHVFSMLTGSLFALIAFATNLTTLQVWPGSAAALTVIAGMGYPCIAIWITYYSRRFARDARTTARRNPVQNPNPIGAHDR